MSKQYKEFAELLYPLIGSENSPGPQRKNFLSFIQTYLSVVKAKNNYKEDENRIRHIFDKYENLQSFEISCQQDDYNHVYTTGCNIKLNNSSSKEEIEYYLEILSVSDSLEKYILTNNGELLVERENIDKLFKSVFSNQELEIYNSIELFEKQKLEQLIVNHKPNKSSNKI